MSPRRNRRRQVLDDNLMAKVIRTSAGKVRVLPQEVSIDKRLDNLVREIALRKADYKCVSPNGGGMRCGGPLQASHIIPKARGQFARWLIENIQIQCRTHHMFWWHGTNPRSPAAWAVSYYGTKFLERIEWLISSRRDTRIDKVALEIYLMAELKKLGGGERTSPDGTAAPSVRVDPSPDS